MQRNQKKRQKSQFRKLSEQELIQLDPGQQIAYQMRLKEYRKECARKIRRRILIGLLCGVAAIFAIAAVKILPLYAHAKKSIPSILEEMDEDTFRRTGDTKIYDSSGALIGQLGNERYQYVPYDKISTYIINGYIAEEDQDFLNHKGVDIKATMRAVVALVKNRGEITQGGSTITMQMVKNNLLTQEQSYQRKVTEMLLALEVEKVYSKEQIMEFYCNSNYYGQNCYGVEGAAQYYFGKSASDVTLAEAAILVGTSNSPNNYNPVASYEKATDKKMQVLDAMLECGYISKEEYDVAVAEDPTVVKKSENADADSYQISYAIHCTALELMEQDGFQFQYKFPTQEEYDQYQSLYSETYNLKVSEVRGGGYSIYTSFDQGLQAKLQASVDGGLEGFTDTQEDGRYSMQGAAVCIDNATQMVVAVVGGRGTEDAYNRGYLAERQPGSCIKPLLDYAPAINEGVAAPATTYTDKKVEVDGYSPKNSNGRYRGKMTLREALDRSINTVAFQLYMDTGADTCLSYLDKLHFSSLCYADSTAYSVSIGGFTKGVTVADMARGYATLANGGNFSDNTCLVSVLDHAGNLVYEKQDSITRVFNESTSFIVTDMLEGVFNEAYGTAYRYRDSSQVYAGKTGTTNDNKDAWFCGYSKYYTVAVWCGYDTPKSVSGLSGGSYPARIWSDFMETVHEGLEKSEFIPPQTVLLANRNGKTRDADYYEDVYTSRPSGYDYIPTEYAGQMLEDLKDSYRENLTDTIESLLEDFENLQVSSPNDRLAVENSYQSILAQVNELPDGTEKSYYQTRLDDRYRILSGQVSEMEEQEDIMERDYQATSQTNTVNNYIQQLNQMSSHSEEAEAVIAQARAILRELSGTDAYADLSFRLDAAVEYVRGLPEEE